MSKLFIFSLVISYVVLVFCLLTSCRPLNLYLVESEGIFTMNRQTGQMELLWQTKAKSGESVTDTAHVRK